MKIWGIHSVLKEEEKMVQEVENQDRLAADSQEILITSSGMCNSSFSTSNVTVGWWTAHPVL